MSRRKDDDFREINEEFNDIDNFYFPFNEDASFDDYEPPTQEEMMDLALNVSDMMSTIISRGLNYLPKEMQDVASVAFDAAFLEVTGDAEESHKLIKKLIKDDKNNPSLHLAQARYIKERIVDELKSKDSISPELLKKERKALQSFLKREDGYEYINIKDYIWARIENARVALLQGEVKGIFNAYIEIPDDDFDMMDLCDAINEYYEDSDSDIVSENGYMFLTESGSAVAIEYTDPTALVSELSPELKTKYIEMFNSLSAGRHSLSIIVAAGDELVESSFDFQQILLAAWSVCGNSDFSIIYDTPCKSEDYERIKLAEDDGELCIPYLADFFIENVDGKNIVMTFAARRWGRIELGIECNDDMANAMVLLGNIFYNHLFRAYKEGNTIRIDDKDYIFRKKVFEDHDYLLIEKVE